MPSKPINLDRSLVPEEKNRILRNNLRTNRANNEQQKAFEIWDKTLSNHNNRHNNRRVNAYDAIQNFDQQQSAILLYLINKRWFYLAPMLLILCAIRKIIFLKSIKSFVFVTFSQSVYNSCWSFDSTNGNRRSWIFSS